MSTLLDIGNTTSYEEKIAWITGLTAAGSYLWYLNTVLGRAQGVALPGVPYVGALLWSVALSVSATVALHIVVALLWPRDANTKDQRDREIYRFGEYVGQSFVVIGAIAALLLALARFDHFWIANAIYLGFVLSALLGSMAKIAAYRRGLPRQ